MFIRDMLITMLAIETITRQASGTVLRTGSERGLHAAVDTVLRFADSNPLVKESLDPIPSQDGTLAQSVCPHLLWCQI